MSSQTMLKYQGWIYGQKAIKQRGKKTPSADVLDALEKIQEIKESQSRTQSSSSSLKDDGLSQVLREDKPGRTVVGLGFGVTPGNQQGGNKSGQVGKNRSGSENVQTTQVNTTESQHDSTTNEPM